MTQTPDALQSGPPRRVAIVQARVSSSRLPGKVLADLDGRPLIVFMLERVRRARRVDAVVVATSVEPSDDRLAEVVRAAGFVCHRGSLDDVLDRFHAAARVERATQVVRLTGDCPLMDPDLIDHALARLDEGHDYVSNIDPPAHPDGLDVEAMTFAALDRAWREARLASEREHVTPYLRRADAGVRRASWRAATDGAALRWTVDHPDDLEHVRALVAAARAAGAADFDRFDLLRLIERGAVPDQAGHRRNEGYAKSLADDGPRR